MIKILIADDHRIVREGIKQILLDAQGLQVAGEAASGNETLKKICQEDWDVLVLDMSMPGRNGIQLIKQIKHDRPKLPILVLSMHKEDLYGVRAIKAGASGYLTKNSASTQLILAIKKIANGGLFVSRKITEKLLTDITSTNTNQPHLLLSDREYQIFQMIISGNTLSEIANILCLSIKTISTHKKNMMNKMKINSTAGLVHYSLKHNLVEEGTLFPD
ncbi:MAG: response regulator transcription factor [Proteobacteria bacterium]|nr:response regulator transcription factor [Pseudomonadota bacterium]